MADWYPLYIAFAPVWCYDILLLDIDDLPEDERECFICKSEYGVFDPALGGVPACRPIQLCSCGHKVGEHCFLRWASQHNTCPLCQQEVPIYIINNNTSLAYRTAKFVVDNPFFRFIEDQIEDVVHRNPELWPLVRIYNANLFRGHITLRQVLLLLFCRICTVSVFMLIGGFIFYTGTLSIGWAFPTFPVSKIVWRLTSLGVHLYALNAVVCVIALRYRYTHLPL